MGLEWSKAEMDVFARPVRGVVAKEERERRERERKERG
jgi:hypothetical protein